MTFPTDLLTDGQSSLLLVQIVLLVLGVLAVFFVLYTTRDVLLRTHSFFAQFFAILLVACVPILGFLLYVLMRPSRTLKEQEVESLLRKLLAHHGVADDGELAHDGVR